MIISEMVGGLKRRITSFVNTVRAFSQGKQYLQVLLVFSLFFLVFLWMYMTLDTVSTSDDHFFHFRFAEEMRGKGILSSFWEFKAIYFSKMAQGEHFVYYNFLYYILIIPFTYIQPLFLGMKLYAVCAASLSFAALYWVLRNLKVHRAFLWTFAWFSVATPNLLARFFSSRPYTLAPILLLLLLYFLHKKNYLGVFVLSFLYIFFHSATFFFPAVVIFAYFIFEKFYGEKGDTSNVFFGIGGVILSLSCILLISPGFLYYMGDIVFGDILSGVLKLSIKDNIVNISEGAELYPVDFFSLLKGSYIVFSALIICISVFVFRYVMTKIGGGESDAVESVPSIFHNRALVGTSFVLTALFFLGTVAVSGRFQDYFVFFGALFIVIYLSEILLFVRIDSALIKKALGVGIAISFCYLFVCNVLSLRETMARGPSAETFKAIGEWLDKNVPAGNVVFNTSWNWFPQLYYHSPSHNYVAGIEPRFLHEYNPALYWKWYHIGDEGYVCAKESCPDLENLKKSLRNNTLALEEWYKQNGEQIADTLINDFHTSYIITSNDYQLLNQIFDNNNRFTRRFVGIKYFIYEVKSQ